MRVRINMVVANSVEVDGVILNNRGDVARLIGTLKKARDEVWPMKKEQKASK